MNWKAVSRLVVLPYTLFALPWFLISVLLVFADPVLSPLIQAEPTIWFWMVIAFVSARIAGMSFNRVIDQEFDQANPRTQDRGLVTGEVTPRDVYTLAWGASALFVVACGKINITCLLLAPISVVLLWGYSYLKRLTPWCQAIMALNHALVPVFVWAALTGYVGVPALILGGAMWSLFAANDIIYGIQDMMFDRSMNLYSVATTFGAKQAVWIAWASQGLAICLLWELGLLLSLGWTYTLGVTLVGCLIVYFDSLVDIDHPVTIQAFLFRANSWVGMLLLLVVIVSRLYG